MSQPQPMVDGITDVRDLNRWFNGSWDSWDNMALQSRKHTQVRKNGVPLYVTSRMGVFMGACGETLF